MKLAIPTAVELPNLMRSEVLVGARVCATDGEASESDAISALHSSKIDECSLLTCDRGKIHIYAGFFHMVCHFLYCVVLFVVQT